jgi:hypothetical protein
MGGSNVDAGSCRSVWAPVREESSAYSLKLFRPPGIEAARVSDGRLGSVGLHSDDLAMLAGSKVGDDLIAGGPRVEM